MLKSFIVMGASLGAWLGWILGTKLNALFPTIPPGTVVANMEPRQKLRNSSQSSGARQNNYSTAR